MLTDADLLNARILIVDDQSAHVHLLERLLHDAGYLNVSATIDPQQVSALHREHRYDLILLDLQMPVLDGFGVMAALQADADDGVLPVIALTAQPGHKLRALQAGARDFINKPFDMVEVKIRIHHMLEVRLLYKMMEAHNLALERTVQERTAALQESESRYRSLTELAADWYWEQNEAGEFTRGYGPVLEKVATRQPFLDFVVHRLRADGSRQQFRVSGEPMFDRSCRITGYRGVGTEVLPGSPTG
jgi:DNA-binding response OmpR family regulator